MSHAKTHPYMDHRILTAHGISSQGFTKMLVGVGQESSNGPSGWHSVCEVIMAVYRELYQYPCEDVAPLSECNRVLIANIHLRPVTRITQ